MLEPKIINYPLSLPYFCRMQVIFSDNVSVRGPQLLPYLKGFHNLRELDISAPLRSSLGSSSCSPLILEDKDVINFFHQLNLNFG